jgi:YVTN family beta-propeller protein
VTKTQSATHSSSTTTRARLGTLATAALLAVPLAIGSAQPAFAGTGPYTETATISMGSGPQNPVGLGLDEYTNDVYAANYSSGNIDVIDESTDAVTDRIYEGDGPLGLAVDQVEGLVFVTNYNDGTVGVLDDTTNTMLGSVRVGDSPSGVAVDELTGLVFVANSGSDSVSVIDESTGKVTHTIAVGSTPVGVAVDESTGTVFVTNSGGPSMSVIDETTLKVTATVSVEGDPTAVAVDEDAGTVFVANDDQGEVSVIDEATDTVIHTTPELGGEGGTSDGLTVDEATSGGVVLFPIDAGTYAEGASINCGSSTGGDVFPNAVTGVVVDQFTNTIFCANQQANTVSAIEEPVAITSDGPVNVLTANSSYSTTFTARGPAPVTFAESSGALPPGLTLDGTTGVLSGVPTSMGDFTFAVTATDADHDAVTQWYEVVVDPVVNRVSGSDRYETSIAVANQLYPSSASIVYVASGTNYPDALSAGPIAAQQNAPVLLTDPTSLPTEVATEITKLDPSGIVVVGGTGSVSAKVFDQLQGLEPSATVSRIAGNDRYATSRALVSQVYSSAATVFVATGANFPDALAAGAAASELHGPLLLINGSANTLDSPTKALLETLGPISIKIAGGSGVVSAGVASELATYGHVTRLEGSDRYGTAEAVNSASFSTASHAFLATGTGFPDALSATPWAADVGGPLFLSQPNCLPNKVFTDMEDLEVGEITLIGGTGVLSDHVEDLTPCDESGEFSSTRAGMFAQRSGLRVGATERKVAVSFGG